MEGLLEFIKANFTELTAFDFVLIWLVIAMYREVLKPLHKLLTALSTAIAAGHFSHAGIEEKLSKLTKALESPKSSQ